MSLSDVPPPAFNHHACKVLRGTPLNFCSRAAWRGGVAAGSGKTDAGGSLVQGGALGREED